MKVSTRTLCYVVVLVINVLILLIRVLTDQQAGHAQPTTTTDTHLLQKTLQHKYMQMSHEGSASSSLDNSTVVLDSSNKGHHGHHSKGFILFLLSCIVDYILLFAC